MKFYEDPILDVQKIQVADVITASPDENETDRVGG